MASKKTEFSKVCEIIASFWIEYKEAFEFQEFFATYDLGIPLALSISQGIVGNSDESKMLILETWKALLGEMDIKDAAFQSYEEFKSLANLN